MMSQIVLFKTPQAANLAANSTVYPDAGEESQGEPFKVQPAPSPEDVLWPVRWAWWCWWGCGRHVWGWRCAWCAWEDAFQGSFCSLLPLPVEAVTARRLCLFLTGLHWQCHSRLQQAAGGG